MRHLLLPVFALTLAACHPGGKAEAGKPGASTVQVAGAICRPTPVGRRSTGCYLTLTASADDRLTGASSPAARRVQIHESRMESGMMMMRELKDGLALPAGQAVALAPTGNHLMVLGLSKPLVVGETVALTLTFANAAPVEITAAVAQPPLPESDGAHDGHADQT